MVKFDELRLEKDRTYTVVPGGLALDMSWFFKKNGVKYTRLSIRDIRKKKNKTASELFDEEKMKDELQIFLKNGSDDDEPCILITHFNKDDLIKKALEIMLSPKDKDLIAYKKRRHEVAMELSEKNPDLHGIMM